MKNLAEILKGNAEGPIVVRESERLALAADLNYRELTDEQLLALVKRQVRGITSRRTGQLIMPLVSVVNETSVVNRPMCVAMLRGTN